MTGYIAELGRDEFKHSFGGSGWSSHAPVGASPPPTLLMTLDFWDPRVGLGDLGCELPLISRIDGEYPDTQAYVFDVGTREVAFEGPSWTVAPDLCAFSHPLEVRSLRLRELRANEDPEISLDDAIDQFVGGQGFLRIRGTPLWLYSPQVVTCTCGRNAAYVASIGYEKHSQSCGIISDTEAFFVGESGFYFFLCTPCRRVVVLTQPT